DNIATNPVKGNLCQGLSGKQLDLSMSKESGKTCMNPVARMMPEAKALMMMKRLRSGLSAGTERAMRGKETPMMLVKRIEAMPMSFNVRAFDLLLHELVLFCSHLAPAARVVLRNNKCRMNTIKSLLML
nr:hypothetical protein [Tanacetum cinerariifolium]